MFRRPRILVVAAVTLIGWLLAASAASAQAPGGVGGGGMFAGLLPSIHLPSVSDILDKIVKGIFGALANALLPDFITDAPDKLVTWLATLPNPTEHGSNVYSLMQTTRATGIALLAIVLLQGVVRGMIPGEHDHPVVVLSRVVGVGAFLALYEWLFASGIALFNTLSVGLLHNRVVAAGMKATVERTFTADAIGGPLPALLVLVALLTLIGLLLVKIMLLYLLPLVFVAWPLVAPLSVPRETAHIPKTMGVLFGMLCAIPAGWALLFGVAGALASDMDAGRVSGAGFLDSGMLAPLTTIGVFALAVWWPFALLGMAKSLPGQFGFTATKGPVARASNGAGNLMKLKLASMVASGGMGAFLGAKAGAGGDGSRLAADAGGAARRRAAADPGSAPPRRSSPTATAAPVDATDAPAGRAGPAQQSVDGGRRRRGSARPSAEAAPTATAEAPGAAAAAAAAPGVDGDPLRPGSGPASSPSGATATPGQRSREAAGPNRPSTAPTASTPNSAAAAAKATNSPSDVPSGAAERTGASARPQAAPRPAAPAQARGGAHGGQGRPAVAADQPSGPHRPPPDTRPASAPERSREASDVRPAPPRADQSPSIGGLAPASQAQDSAREAFGKDQS